MKAASWWDTTGRLLVKAAATTEEVGQKVSTSTRGPMIRVSGDIVPTLKSGILRGETFDRLTRREAVQVVNSWIKEQWLPKETGAPVWDIRQPLDYLSKTLEVTEADLVAAIKRSKTEGGDTHKPRLII